MKKISKILIGVLALTFVLSACGQSAKKDAGDKSDSNQAPKKKVVVGFSVGTSKQERWQREIEMAKAFAKEKGFELIVQSAEEDPVKQVQQIDNMLSQGVQALLVAPQDSESSGVIVDKAHQAGVPVVSYDRLIRNGDLDYYATFDNEKVGELQAKSLVEKYPKGNYIWLLGGPEDNNAHLIERGQNVILKPFIDKGDIKIVLKQANKGWSPEEALKNTENGLTKANNDVVAVVASNDGLAGAAVQALTAQKLQGKVGVSGQDAEISAVQRIAEGTQTSTVYKPLKNLNTAAMELVYALASNDNNAIDSFESGRFKNGHLGFVDNGKKAIKTLLMDVTVVTKENLADTVIKDGFHKLEDVYKNVPKDQWSKLK